MTCSHMSYFFISKQLLWELFFRISNSNVSFKYQVYSKSKINDCNNIPGGTTALAFGSSLNAPIEDGRAAVICIESKTDKIKSQYAFGLTTATGIIKSRYCLYNDGEETWTNWK